MHYSVHTFILVFLFAALSVIPTAGADRGPVRAALQSRYSRAHSLGHSYEFDARDGWQNVNVTNLQYKYRGPHDSAGANLSSFFWESTTKRSKSRHPSSKQGLGSAVVETIKAIGESASVIITWRVSRLVELLTKTVAEYCSTFVAIFRYTGHDLLNPSCWSKTGWAPTDDSFVCAVTLEGWTTRPKCFEFLQLCNSPKKCVFVRVVDTCEGCSKGTKHVDLTRSAFSQLASTNEGLLSAQMRLATAPTQWNVNLWGPKEA